MSASLRYSFRWLSYELGIPAARLKALALRVESCYHPYEARRGTKTRLIDNPNDELKGVQRQIRDRLLVPIPLADHVHGCVRGRSAYTNAMLHTGRASLASVDIKSCYPSITNATVFRCFAEQLKLGQNLARLLTRLTTRAGHLPTGAPTSDALANLILGGVDEDIAAVAKRLQLSVSRYVDNIDFSGPGSGAAIEPTIRSLHRQGFSVPRKKVFTSGPSKAHVVTGFTVNARRPTLGRRFRNNMRSACHELIVATKNGTATDRMTRRTRGRLEHLRIGHPQAAEALFRQLQANGVAI